MLKLPKGLKKKKKGKKSKRKGEEELFTEEELEKYKKEHQQKAENAGSTTKENEEWSKFKDLTTGVDSVLKKTQGDLDRIKSTSFFQRVTIRNEIKPAEKEKPVRPVVEVTEADFPHLAQARVAENDEDKSDYGVTDDESEEEDEDYDIFDTSYIDAVQRGEVKLAYVPDSPEENQDDDIFDTSYVNAIIKGQEVKSSKGKKELDIGIAVEVLTGRIDNVKVTTKRAKRTIPGDLLLESDDKNASAVSSYVIEEPVEKSILDFDADIPIATPIDLSTSLVEHIKKEVPKDIQTEDTVNNCEDEVDEFTLLAAESLECKVEVSKLDESDINIEPVLQEAWSAFEANSKESVFAEGIVEDQLDVLDPYIDQDDPFDTSFADAIIPQAQFNNTQEVVLEDDDDFDPRADEVQVKLNNRRKSSVRIHLTDPSGIRESITSDDIIDNNLNKPGRDLLGGSTTDLTLLADSPLNPIEVDEIDPFDTTIVDKIVAPGKVELKLLEKELIDSTPAVIYKVPSDPDFDPRADETEERNSVRRSSRPENLTVSKSVVFNVDGTEENSCFDKQSKPNKPLTPYYTRELSISEDLSEDFEAKDKISNVLQRTRSDDDLSSHNISVNTKRRYSEFPQTGTKDFPTDLLQSEGLDIKVKVLTPAGVPSEEQTFSTESEDPFDTSFASDIKPSKTELRLLAKEFSCEDSTDSETKENKTLLETEDDLFQIKALTPEPSDNLEAGILDSDPFDTSFASNLAPGKTEVNINEPATPITAEVLNPFMMTANNDQEDMAGGDNPFAASNPFSDFENSYEPPVGDTVPTDIFGNSEPINIGAKQFDDNSSTNIFHQSIEEPLSNDIFVKPTELDLVSNKVNDSFTPIITTDNQDLVRPVPQETQNLILSVTGQMEFTSSHLLNRIPPTRTPSPVSVRDIHSPSPTPDLDMLEDSQGADSNVDLSLAQSRPARPPPVRPPRPAPPPRPQLPPPAQASSLVDDINLFEAPVPVVVKPTKEAILSLYAAPKKEEKPIDFLSDDIIDLSSNSEQSSNIVPTSSEPTNEPEHLLFTNSSTVVKASSQYTQSTGSDITVDAMDHHNTNADMDTSEPTVETIENTSQPSPFILNESMEVNQPYSEIDKNPFDITDEDITTNVSSDIFGVNASVSPVSDTFQNLPSEDRSVQDTLIGEDMDVGGGTIYSTENVFDSGPIKLTPKQDVDNSVDFGWSQAEEMIQETHTESQDAFDAFAAKFDSVAGNHLTADAWGDDGGSEAAPEGFESEVFDPFLHMQAPPAPAATPRLDHQGSADSADDTFSVFIRPKDSEAAVDGGAVPALAPPPRPQIVPDSPRANPFDKSAIDTLQQQFQAERPESGRGRSGSGGETPPTPLFDDDVSVPLEDFPRTTYAGPGWEMHLRQPNKKKITGQRFWKKVWVRVVGAGTGESPAVQVLAAAGDREPLHELPLQACYSVSDIAAQQFDQFGKIFTVKLQYVFYKERPGVRPGQVTKAERITNKLSQFAAYAIQGDYQGVKEFGSDLRKLGLPVEHAPQVSQLFKLGSLNYEHVKEFSCCVEEALFRIAAHRDRALTYKMEEVQVTAVDELYVEQEADGAVVKQIARVRLFFLGFLSGMPDIELGVNDMRRQGKEVVGRHDIIPVVTEEWIRVEDPEFHACVQPDEFDKCQIIKFKPPDACYIELMRFRVRPPKNRELPLQLKAVWCVTGNKVELRADVLVPGFASRKLGQVPCEDVAVRFPIPECWIYLFRVEKHFRYGSVKSAHRRTGKIKGIERFLGAVDTLQESLIEVTSGQAKYEHQHRAIVWRMPRLPKEGQGAYTSHNLVCRMALTSYDQIPEQLAQWAYVEFTMPATQVSHMTVRSVSLQNHDNDPPEKYVRYLARHEYRVGIERTSGTPAAAYSLAAAAPDPKPEPAPAAAPTAPAAPSSDSDSD
ncbi:protein stoned-B [Pieris rapae]|uniref:protein stoned-B n=1 Tax=Pieris rapae TaxID=64459 RepID=UPI001E27D971|nr:protein stoned-B [Pieris rapae]